MPSQQTSKSQASKAQASKAQAPQPSAGRSSKVEVEFHKNRVSFSDYQMGALLDTIAAVATKLGMSGRVHAYALEHTRDSQRTVTDKEGMSTWKVELHRPIIDDVVAECIVLQIRTSYTLPPVFGRK